jgi:hypothetical protein
MGPSSTAGTKVSPLTSGSSNLNTRWHNTQDLATKVLNLTHTPLNIVTHVMVSSYKSQILNGFLPKMIQQICSKNIPIVTLYFYTI